MCARRSTRRSASVTSTRTAEPSSLRATLPAMSAVLDDVAGQEAAVAFLRRAAERPHHAYVLAGPEGSGKSLVARAFVAALLCPNGGGGARAGCARGLRAPPPT